MVVDILFESLYGALITSIALLAAIPYGIWQGARWLGSKVRGGTDGNAGTGR